MVAALVEVLDGKGVGQAVWLAAGVLAAGLVVSLLWRGDRKLPRRRGARRIGTGRHKPPPGIPERRRHVRRAGRPVEVAVTGTGNVPKTGWVIDRSEGGVCLMVKGSVPVGAILHVVPLKAAAGTTPVSVEVRNRQEEDDHSFLGCQFLETTTPEGRLLFG